MDKINNINARFNNINPNYNLPKDSKQQQSQQEVNKEAEAPKPQANYVDPDKVMDAMAKHGVLQMMQSVSFGQVKSKSIEDSVNFFTNTISPEMHAQLTERATKVFQKEFPTTKMDPDFIAETVDTMIFDSLMQ